MLVLQDIQEPNQDVVSIQPQVTAYWEKDCLGQGSLFLTNSIVTWIANATKKGFRLTYPAIAVHAVSGQNEDFPEPSLFLMIDVNKTDIEYEPEVNEVDDEVEEDDDIKTAAIRFVPADPSAISTLYETMNRCQEQNPDPDEEMSDEGDELEATEIIGSGGDEQLSDSGHWFTSDNLGDEIHLSAEGRANLERMLGNLNDIPGESNGGTHENSNEHQGDNTMDES
ncbi:regulator of volume decrease after cellular swelling domain-containing protein [Ditylenchus destructor]|nr:regulator of volume decrease after cellular swelling domain-containing protein [Ditylenchus destructor]